MLRSLVGSEMCIRDSANEIGVGAILEQFHGNNWESIGFFSKALHKAELNYSTFSKELLSIDLAIKHFKYILEGSQFHIETDCKAIIGAFNSNNTRHSPREARALELIAQFTKDIRHIKGSENRSDKLSQRPINGNLNNVESLNSSFPISNKENNIVAATLASFFNLSLIHI